MEIHVIVNASWEYWSFTEYINSELKSCQRKINGICRDQSVCMRTERK
jgi:hypothetical protein